MASYKLRICSIILATMLASCTVAEHASQQSLDMERRKGLQELQEAKWATPSWYKYNISVIVTEKKSDINSCKLLICTEKYYPDHYFLSILSILSVVFFNIVGIIFFLNRRNISFLFINKHTINFGFLIGNIVPWVAAEIVQGQNEKIVGSPITPWHYALMICYFVEAIFPFAFLLLIALSAMLIGLIILIFKKISKILKNVNIVRRNKHAERLKLRQQRSEQRKEQEEESEGDREHVRAIIRNIELSAGLMRHSSPNNSDSLKQEFMINVLEVTGKEKIIRSNLDHIRALKDILKLLNAMNYDKYSIEYRKILQLLR